MNPSKIRFLRKLMLTSSLILTFAPLAFQQSSQINSTQSDQTNQNISTQQDNTGTTSNSKPPASKDRPKVKIKGFVVERANNTFTIKDAEGVTTVANLTDSTRISEIKTNPFRSAKTYTKSDIQPGLRVTVEGRKDATGRLVAEKVRFSSNDLRIQRAVEIRLQRLEDRLSKFEGDGYKPDYFVKLQLLGSKVKEVETTSTSLSNRMEKLSAVSNEARSDAKAARETAVTMSAVTSQINANINRMRVAMESEQRAREAQGRDLQRVNRRVARLSNKSQSASNNQGNNSNTNNANTSGTPPSTSTDLTITVEELRNLPLGFIQHDIQTPMRVGEKKIVHVHIAKENTEELGKGLNQPSSSKPQKMIPIGPPTNVDLIDIEGDAFTIKRTYPKDQGAQVVIDGIIREWTFEVTPLQSGSHYLRLEATMLVRAEYGLTPYNYVVFNDQIKVNVNPLFSIESIAKTNWQWIINTIITSGIIGYLWQQHRKPKETTTLTEL